MTQQEEKLVSKVCPTKFNQDCECQFCTTYNQALWKLLTKEI